MGGGKGNRNTYYALVIGEDEEHIVLGRRREEGLDRPERDETLRRELEGFRE
jgi:hypothetical protein